jgi:tetratricopeptide (TPR) repeat protein
LPRCMIVFIFLSIVYTRSFGASLEPDDSLITAVTGIIDYVYSDKFDSAYSVAMTINDTLPGKPFYNLIVASILHAEMTDLEDYSKAKEFFSRLDLSKKHFEKWTDGNPGDPWGYYFVGMVHAYKAMLHAQRKKWLKAFIEGYKAKGRFSRAIELDPELYDAYAGLGNFHFWSSVKLKKYLPFLKDNKAQGLRELRIAADSSIFSSKPAATGLAWALLDQKRFPEATKIGLDLYRESSGGRISLWIMGSASWRGGRLDDAVRYYGELIESLNSIEKQNYYNLIFCRYRKGVALFLMGRYEEAEKELNILLSYDAPKETRDRHKKTYGKAKEYLQKIEDRYNRRR